MIRFPFSVPVEPDRPGARQLLADELAKQEYQRAKPTWFDELVARILDWFNSLHFGSAQGPPAFGMLVLLVVIGVLLLIAFLVFGLPRLNRRSTVTGSLFGEDDARTAAQMRAAAEAAAATGDYALAIAEMYRAIARGLAERTVLTTSPGTTAHDFAARAASAFPARAAELSTSARAFDEVRYLDRPGSREQYEQVTALERRLRSAKPAAREAVGA
jgi:hypothetical protein